MRMCRTSARDFCSNLTGVEQYLDASASDVRPVFGIFRPMNIHILNTMRGGQRMRSITITRGSTRRT